MTTGACRRRSRRALDDRVHRPGSGSLADDRRSRPASSERTHLAMSASLRRLRDASFHRPAHLFVVDLLLRLPVGPGVVDLQALVEIKKRIGPAVERHSWSFHLRWALGNRSRKSRLWHRRRMNRRVRPADSSLSYTLTQDLAVVRSAA